MRVLKFAGIIFLAALALLAGCSTSPREIPPDWSAAGETPRLTNSPPLIPIPISISAVVKTNPPVLVRSNLPPSVAHPAPVLTWTSLDRWAKENNNIGTPRHLTTSPLSTWSLTSRSGTFVLAIGSREAYWNGVIVHLGFAPEMIDDQIFVHGLDLQKTVAPLLTGESLAFSSTNRVIVIDPGHGGINAGTLNVLGGHPEKDFTLDWARRLVPLLQSNGWTVYLTRTNDTDVTLFNRVMLAGLHRADLFISLHFNSSAPDKRQGGLETYCITPTRMPSTLTRGYADLWSENYPNNAFDVQNLLLAVRLHTAVLHASGEEDRGVRRARFMGVLQGQHRPAILIEGGYLSNPSEAGRIGQSEFRQKLAEAVASALRLDEDGK